MPEPRRNHRPCTVCGLPQQSRSNICRPCSIADARKSCLWCGTLTEAEDRYCKNCAPYLRSAARHVDRYEDALPAGRWVSDGRGILVYEPDPPRVIDQPRHCGSEQGYQWHRHKRINWPLPADDPCGCRAAHREHWHLAQGRARQMAA